jgi:Kef-type K+ transport system membrane component KefB
MIYRITTIALLLACAILVVHSELWHSARSVTPTFILGFVLLTAYCIGYILSKSGLPEITGFILAGFLLGPSVLHFFKTDTLHDLDFINSLALAFIAFCAGGELKLAAVKKKMRVILFMITGMTSITFFGVTAIVFAISNLVPFLNGHSPLIRLSISALFGVIAVARSPSSAIAIINETKAEGDYTTTVLSVTIVMDVVVIVLFGVILSICQNLISAGSPTGIGFTLEIIIEILIAFLCGFILGKGVIFLIERLKVEFPIVIMALGFFVIKFSHLLGSYLHEVYDIGLNLEPLLICMAAGFTVQNTSAYGKTFINSMNRVSLPIYIAFFAMTGASIDLSVLKTGWFLGVVIVISRITMVFVGSFLSGKLAKDQPKNYRNMWLGFITQAGVSLGLVAEIVRRFPQFGGPIQTILVTTITVNQIIGPIAFKYAIGRVGESRISKQSDLSRANQLSNKN